MKPDPLHIIRALLLLVTVLLFFESCIKEEFDADVLNTSIRFTPGVAAPVGFVHYQLEELFRDSVLSEPFTVDENGFITLEYEEEIASLDASGLFIFSDINQSVNIVNNTGAPIILDDIPPGGSVNIRDTIRIPFDIPASPDAELDSITVRSMNFTCRSFSSFNGPVSIYGPFSAGIQLNGGSVTQTLTDFTISLENIPPNRNELVIVCLASITRSAGTIQPGSSIARLDIRFSDLDYTAIYGYLGTFNIPVRTQSIPINLYNSIEEGAFHFEDASLIIGISNSFGIPVQVEMTNFQSTGREGQVVFITGDSVPSRDNPRLIGYPGKGQEGQSIRDSILLTTTNTNLFTVLESAPTRIMFGVSGSCNPGGITHDNFLLDTSRVNVTARLILPLHGWADLLLISDTIDFVFNDFYENPPEEIKSLTFRLNFTNGLPVNINFQAYFLDAAGIILDSLFSDLQDPLRLVPGATDTDGDGRSEPVEADPVEISFDRNRIDNISSTRYLHLYGRFSTVGYNDSPPVNIRFYDDYFFTAHLGAIAGLDVNSSGF